MRLRKPPLLLALLLAPFFSHAASQTLVLKPPSGVSAKGKHVVLLSGDEEYRSEESMPMLAKILSQRHGFECTVLFALDPDGRINPENTRSLPGAEALDRADLIVMNLRFRDWPDAAMKHFVDAFQRGVPIVALRTSTHAFNFSSESAYLPYTWNSKGPWVGGFGKQVLGETWVTHWGRHKVEAMRGLAEPSARDNPVLRGVGPIFADSDTYEAYPPADAAILMRGQVLTGMKPSDPPATHRKKRKNGGDTGEQAVNDPMMPVAWTRLYRNESGRENRIFTTTMGAATDLKDESLRRLVVNAIHWGLALEVPARADVATFDGYAPLMYGFGGYRRGITVGDHALGRVLRAGDPAPSPAPAKRAEAPPPAAPTIGAPLSLNPGDRVAFLGNALADRMQHHGWLESLLHAKYPRHDLVVRNLAVSGDEVATRARSLDFGTPDQWLTRVRANVILAFFGFNESFHGEAGLSKFKADLDQFLSDTRARKYDGATAPRIVLFSPIANEILPDPNFAAPPENNRNLALYTAAMAEVARDRAGVTFVNLFEPSRKLYAEAAGQGRTLTHNGFHLTEQGEALLAPVIFQAVLGEAGPAADITRLRAAVNEKNRQWHARYRTVDGYNVYGGRSSLEYQSGKDGPRITNFQVMQEEMSQRDVLTANRDRRVWAVARGGDLAVDDGNLPPVTEVKTNKPGANPDGSHAFVSGEDAIALMKPAAGLKVNLFASEKEFPELAKPVQMAWDTRGRLWVAVWPSYPERSPTSKTGDSLLVFEDTDGDGKADKCTHFLDDLNCPTGFQFHKDGVLVVQAPDLWFVRDTDGDGRADWRERVLMGLDSADSHHTANSVVYEPGGAIFLSDGVFHRTQVETALGPVRNLDAAIYRYEPATGKFETYVSYGFANPHGRAFDRWGNDLIVDATGNNTYFGPAFSGRIDYPAKHPRMREIWQRPSRPSAASAIVTSRHFPDEYQGNFLNGNVIGFLGFYRVKLIDDGSGLRGERLPDFISSSDPNFRPVALSVGPDGAVYFLDWHNPIIGHMQHHLRDPNRDHAHGRVYRVTCEDRPLLSPPKIHGQPIPALLELLKEPENHVRELAKVELGRHDSPRVIAALKDWVSRLDRSDSDYQHHLTEALWVHQWHNVVDGDFLRRMLASPDADARAAATRVLCYWRDRVPDALALLARQAVDEHPRVRLQAVRAASFFRDEAAVEAALAAIEHPMDYYLDYTVTETLKQLRPLWGRALSGGGTFANMAPARLNFLPRSVPPSELGQLPRTPAVLAQLAKRPKVPEALRTGALEELTRGPGGRGARVVMDVLTSPGETDAFALLKWLQTLPPAELKPVRGDLLAYALGGDGDARAAAWAGVVRADQSFDAAWSAAEKDAETLARLLAAVPLIPDVDVRARVFPRAMALLEGGAAGAGASRAVRRAALRAAVSTRREGPRVFEMIARSIRRGEDVAAGAQALRALPRAEWTAGSAPALAAALVSWAEAVPAEARSGRDFLDVAQAVEELLALTPPAEAAPLRRRAAELRVSTFVVRAVFEQMRYDTTRIVVEPGKPFQLIVENPDAMPHNLVVVRPGARERVAAAAMAMPPGQLDRDRRAFVPNMNEVIAGTRLLEPGQSETLTITAPKAEGVYEFVCTFPGHWTLMWGQLVVTSQPAAALPPAMAGAGAAAHTGHAH